MGRMGLAWTSSTAWWQRMLSQSLNDFLRTTKIVIVAVPFVQFRKSNDILPFPTNAVSVATQCTWKQNDSSLQIHSNSKNNFGSAYGSSQYNQPREMSCATNFLLSVVCWLWILFQISSFWQERTNTLWKLERINVSSFRRSDNFIELSKSPRTATKWLYSLLLLQIALVPKRHQGRVNQWANLSIGELESIKLWADFLPSSIWCEWTSSAGVPGREGGEIGLQ